MAGYDGSHFFTPDGWYQSQRDLITQAIRDRGNWYQLILKVYELDPEVRKSGAKNTDYQNLKSADHLCDKTEDYAKNWTPAAERLWKEKRSRGRGSKFPQNIYCEKMKGDI